MNGTDYCLKLHTADGKARLGYYRYEKLEDARKHATEIVEADPIFELPNPTVKVEVLAGRETAPTEWFDTIVETYTRDEPLRRPNIASERWTCAGMRY